MCTETKHMHDSKADKIGVNTLFATGARTAILGATVGVAAATAIIRVIRSEFARVHTRMDEYDRVADKLTRAAEHELDQHRKSS